MNATYAVVKKKYERNSSLYGSWTHGLNDIGVVLYQLN